MKPQSMSRLVFFKGKCFGIVPMSTDETLQIFICSYCEQPLKFRDDQKGKRIQCPKCQKVVRVLDNRSSSIVEKLSSAWMYERPKLLGLLGSRMVGPITDTELLSLIARGEIESESIVKSPQMTNNQEVPAGRFNFSIIREMCNQRMAEEQRLRNAEARKNARDLKNRETLIQGISKAVSDGIVTLSERTQLLAFAAKAGIADSEVDVLLKQEASKLLYQVVEDSLADGFVDDQKTEQISKIAIGLGLSLELTKDQQFRISVARSAWELLQKLRTGNLPQSLEFATVELFEIVCLKSPGEIPLGDDHYLKSVGTGTLKRSDKALLLDGRLAAKKYTLSSIANVEWFSDGLFVKRSSGKSLFIKPMKFGLDWYQFAMSMEVMTTGEPVIGVLPEEPFIPAEDFDGSQLDNGTVSDDLYALESDDLTDGWVPSVRVPRFAFRVVGEFYENRYLDLNRLRVGDEVYLVREPRNEHDSNAVAVCNSEHKVLGYLKREVSSWFAPILDKGRSFRCEVKERLPSGGIVISVFE
jgi:DNA-directed RNA polymerase subunit RPC12/RpoP